MFGHPYLGTNVAFWIVAADRFGRRAYEPYTGNMTRTTSKRLFTGYRLLTKWFDELDLQLHQACDRHLLVGAALPVEELPGELRREFMLWPLQMPGIMDATVDARAYPVAQPDGTQPLLFRGSVRIPYKGTLLLLRTAPEQGFTFPFKGRIGAKSVHLDTFLPSMDPTDFVAEAALHLARVQEAIDRSRSTFNEWNDRISTAIERKLRTY